MRLALAMARRTSAGIATGAAAASTGAAPPETHGRGVAAWPIFGCAPPVAASAGPASASSSVPKHAARTPPRTSIYLFRRPTGLADGLALKEPALPADYRGIRPN